MKILIAYCSTYHGNTEKIARIFSKCVSCELVDITKRPNIRVSDYGLIGFGSGVYRESLSPLLYRFAEKQDLRNKRVFVFSTSGVGMKFYNKNLMKLLESKGAISIGSYACKGNFVAKQFTDIAIFTIFEKLSQGHPNNKDTSRAEQFMNKIVAVTRDTDA